MVNFLTGFGVLPAMWKTTTWCHLFRTREYQEKKELEM
jgi:hypothetical protein